MPATYVHGKGAALLHGDIDLSPWINSVKASRKLDTGDTSHFGSNSKTYIMGQDDGTMSFGGLYDGKIDAINDYMSTIQAAEANGAAPVPVLLAPAGLAINKPVFGGLGLHTTYEVNTVISDVESVSGDIQLTGGFVAGVALANLTPISATTNGTTVDDTAATTRGGFATLHVLSNANTGTVAGVIQHSADGTTWADLKVFTTVATLLTSVQSAVVVGTINRYLRLKVTLTGTGAVSVTASLSRY